jgi:hypothetical protein
VGLEFNSIAMIIFLDTKMSLLLPLSQITIRLDFSRYIAFATYLDIYYVSIRSKSYVPRKAKTDSF